MTYPHRRLVLIAVLALALTVQLCTATAAFAGGRYIVVLQEGASPAAAARRHGASPEFLYGHAIRGYAAILTDAAHARAAGDPAVRFISEDRPVSLGKPAGGGTTAPSGQAVPTGVRRIGAAAFRTDGSPTNDLLGGDVDVAVIDTGIDLDHPDLRVRVGANCSSGASADDGNGHGSHVAGTIGAIDNGIGVVGVAPAVDVWAYRVLNNAGSGTVSSVICGINRAAENADIEVANLSLGGPGTAQGSCGTTADAYYAAICGLIASDVTVVVAAGNDDVDAATSVPAAFAEALTVSAWADFDGTSLVGSEGKPCRSDVDETFADFSNWGSIVDLTAPGVCIRSTWKGGGYNTISGTSMAAPHVAGAAALWRGTHPDATSATTEAMILGTLEARAIADDGDTTAEGILSIRGW